MNCSDSFGVCGTGLSQEDVTLAECTAHIGTFDDHEHWDFIAFGEGKPLIVAQHTDCSSWTDNAAFTDEGYVLPPEGEAEMKIDWEWLYGKLPPGTYRIKKSIVDVRSVGNNPLYFLTSQFIIAG